MGGPSPLWPLRQDEAPGAGLQGDGRAGPSCSSLLGAARDERSGGPVRGEQGGGPSSHVLGVLAPIFYMIWYLINLQYVPKRSKEDFIF